MSKAPTMPKRKKQSPHFALDKKWQRVAPGKFVRIWIEVDQDSEQARMNAYQSAVRWAKRMGFKRTWASSFEKNGNGQATSVLIWRIS